MLSSLSLNTKHLVDPGAPSTFLTLRAPSRKQGELQAQGTAPGTGGAGDYPSTEPLGAEEEASTHRRLQPAQGDAQGDFFGCPPALALLKVATSGGRSWEKSHFAAPSLPNGFKNHPGNHILS